MREDIEKMINDLIKNDAIYRKTSTLPNVQNSRWE
jgi:hypothetical protein